jgi:hypothetical protein
VRELVRDSFFDLITWRARTWLNKNMEEADDDLIRGEVERETLTSPSPRDVARRTHWGVGVESGWEKRGVVE